MRASRSTRRAVLLDEALEHIGRPAHLLVE
jgi:hypothetical protein